MRFRSVEFDILVSGGAIVAGRPTEAILVVKTPRTISRAKHLALTFRSWLGVKSLDPRLPDGRAELFSQDMHVDLPSVLEAGTFRFPFAFELPAWLPPGFSGNGITLAHEVAVAIDVSWAPDPHATLRAVVESAPREGVQTPRTVRSPRDFHPSIILEVTLDSAVLVQGDPVLGTVRVVGGVQRELEGVELSLVSTVTHLTGRNEPKRSVFDAKVFVNGASLGDSRGAPFEAPFAPFAPASFENQVLRHELALEVKLLTGSANPPRVFKIPVEVLPKGSILRAVSAEAAPLDHLRRWGLAIANATPLRAGTGNLVAYGSIGPIEVRILESPRHMRTGLEVELETPDDPQPPTAHVPLLDDADAPVVEAAQIAIMRARAFAKSLSSAPFAADCPPNAEKAWRAAVREGASLLPAGPSLVGLVFVLSILGADERRIRVDIRTLRPGPSTEVRLDLSSMPLPEEAIGPLQNGQYPEALSSAKALLPSISVSSNGDTLILADAWWTPDPAVLFPAIDAALDWALSMRRERRASSAYR